LGFHVFLWSSWILVELDLVELDSQSASFELNLNASTGLYASWFAANLRVMARVAHHAILGCGRNLGGWPNRLENVDSDIID
jgi:hypothetical protein